MLWLLACAALGGLIGALLAGINGRDSTSGAVLGAIIGGGIVAGPMLLTAGLHALPGWADVVVTLGAITLVVGGLFQMIINSVFGRRPQ
ncbi:MAG TPA: hypothetical protein VIS06_22105 [Mycobacteriales bacterium]|jgi:hypothetical protein